MAADSEPRRRGPTVDLGARIRAERTAAGLALRELARRLGVSPSLLSQIESGRAQPSVGTLWGIVTELGVSLDALFSSDAGAGRGDGRRRPLVQRAGSRTGVDLEGGVRWERLTASPDPHVDFAFVRYAPGRDSGGGEPPATHRGREYGYVVRGRLRVEVGDEVIELGPGDSVVFGSETPHRFRAVGDEPAEAVWFNLALV